MKSEDIQVPATGSDGEMEVIEISVSVGDSVETDDTIVVLESDKATVEVPSPKPGKVEVVAVSVGDKVKEGDVLMKLSATQNNSEEKESSTKNTTKTEGKEKQNSEQTVSENKSDASDFKSQQIVIPDLGGSEQVEVIEVLGKLGEFLKEDDTLIVLETDKATMEIPTPASGKLISLNIKVGDKVSAGDLIAELEVAMSSVAVKTEILKEEVTRETNSGVSPTEKMQEGQKQPSSDPMGTHENSTAVHAGPAVRKFAREHGVDLVRVKATGPRDRILVDDVSAYIKAQVQKAQSGGLSSDSMFGAPVAKLPDFQQFGEISVSSMTKVHLKTAENMQRSWSLPHVTQFDEADISEMETFRKSQKSLAEMKGIKLTPIAFILKASAHVLKQLPQFNVALDLAQHQLIQKHYIHIGFAVDTPHGLFVPVIRDVDKKGIWELAAECQDLASRARDKKLTPAEMQGGCFTISSLGAIGGTAFTPIVNSPEVAILGLSKSQMKPVYDQGKGFVPRLMLPLSLSYDHRAVNGADGARFTTLLSKALGDLRELLL